MVNFLGLTNNISHYQLLTSRCITWVVQAVGPEYKHARTDPWSNLHDFGKIFFLYASEASAGLITGLGLQNVPN